MKIILTWLRWTHRFVVLSRATVLVSIILSMFAPQARASVTFTTNTLINATNLTYDCEDIIINGCTLTVNGPHAFNSVSVTNGAVLTHEPTTTNQVYSLLLTVSNSIVVDASSRIDVSARGYLPGYTVGNSTNGAATSVAGGSYGGLGPASGSSIANAVYGDFRNPTEPGSGSGTYGNAGAAATSSAESRPEPNPSREFS